MEAAAGIGRPVHPHRAARLVIAAAGGTALAALALTAGTGNPMPVLAPATFLLLFVLAHRTLLRWDVLIGTLLLVVLLIPIRRYTLPANLPFELEPYRVVVAVVALACVAALLAEPAMRLRRTGYEAPILLFALAMVLSVVFNAGSIASTGVEPLVVKKLTFLFSFLVVVFVVATVVRTREQIDTVVKVLVVGGSLVALLAIYESWAGDNLFNRLSALPLLDFNPAAAAPEGILGRGGRSRVFASAQHPIALGGALALLLPLAIYLVFRTERRIWWIAVALMTTGALASVSRTPFVMLVVIALTFLWLRPRDAKRLAPAALALILFVNLVIPGALGGIKNQFFPEGGLLAQQEARAGYVGSGRIADLGPSLQEWSRSPIFGEGYGTRVVEATEGVPVNAAILDNQWLGLLLETGAIGVGALLWVLARVLRRLGAAARTDGGPDGWLCAALAASLLAYATGMFTFDAFAFIQVTVLMFVLLGVAMSACGPAVWRNARAELSSSRGLHD